MPTGSAPCSTRRCLTAAVFAAAITAPARALTTARGVAEGASKPYQLDEAVKATEAYVRENPWQAVGIAAGVGLVLGLLISRR